MKKKIILTAGVILVTLILLGVFYLQKNSQRVSKIPCSDSDGGKNIYIKGNASYEDSKGINLHITSDSCAMKNENKQAENEGEYIQGLPSCAGSNCYILEGYCGEYQSSPIDAGEFFQCANGCNDGACNPKE